jgi:hypothetical protein
MSKRTACARMIDPIDLFPGVPLIESPIFGSVLDRMELTDAERRIAVDLHSQGFAVFDFPDEQLDVRIARIRARLAPQLGVEDSNPTAIKINATGRIQDAWQFDDDVRAIASNAAVLELLSKLYGRTAFPFQTLNFPVGTQQHAHTDIVHFSSVPERFMCGVWLAMEDIDPGSGPLCYVPGSHKWPVISNTMVGRRGWQSESESAQTPYHEAWKALIEEHQAPSETFLALKGQALIWCANLLHGGSPQTDPTRTRWSQVTHYFFDDCIYYTPAFSDEPLGRLALRQIINAADGASKPNTYLGEKVGAPEPAPRSSPTRFNWIMNRRSNV